VGSNIVRFKLLNRQVEGKRQREALVFMNLPTVKNAIIKLNQELMISQST
jgi:hypothetical protein